jgi:aminoglycoside phosphotransferase (APT) family kinase protein
MMRRVHDDEFVATAALVRDLMCDQFPQWAALDVTPVPSTGTDNILFRLGPQMSVRMPRIEGAIEQVRLDQRWLPRLAAQLPFTISTPLAVGEPGCGYPFPWAIHAWLKGTNPVPADSPALAEDLAAFVKALSEITVSPPSSRSGPLSTRDEAVRRSLASLSDEIDVGATNELWSYSDSTPRYAERNAWFCTHVSGSEVLPPFQAAQRRLGGQVGAPR